MKRIVLYTSETLAIIIMLINIILQLYCIWNVLLNMSEYTIKVNNENKNVIEKILIEDLEIENIDTIKYSHKWHHRKYVVYYKDGSTKELINDEMQELELYIIENGKYLGDKYLKEFLYLMVILIVDIIIKVNITKKINKLDKMET